MSDVFQKWNPFDLSILHNGVQVLGLSRSLEVGHNLCSLTWFNQGHNVLYTVKFGIPVISSYLVYV